MNLELVASYVLMAGVLAFFISIPQFIGTIRLKDGKQFFKLLVIPTVLVILGFLTVRILQNHSV